MHFCVEDIGYDINYFSDGDMRSNTPITPHFNDPIISSLFW